MIAVPQPRAAQATCSLEYGDYVRFGELVHACFGLSFSEKRRADLERGVLQAFAASTCTDLSEYYDLLRDEDRGATERERLVNALTVGETHFFRNAGQFDALYYHVLPQLIERRRHLRTLRIWSAGCASGEEPYSIAMLLRELLPDVEEWSIAILGTDINTEALDRARKASYGDWAFREDRAREWRARHFCCQGRRWELLPEVQRMVAFARLNLVEDDYPAFETNTTVMDLILCCNVTIYFSEQTTRRIVDRFYDALVDGGWLAVGHSEYSLGIYHRFQARTYPGAILYQRTGEPTPLPVDWEWLTGAPALGPRGPAQESVSPSAPAPVPAGLPDEGDGPIPICGPSSPESLPPLPSAGKTEDPVDRARDLLEYGHSAQSRDLLLEAVRQRPNHVPTCTLLGKAYANLGAWTDAERWCARAVSLDRLALDAYYVLALVLRHQDRTDEAVEAMKKVVYIDRNNVLGHFGLAELYYNQGQFSRALKSLDNAWRLLSTRLESEVIPDSGGLTAGRLRETVVRQQQRWGAQASGLQTSGGPLSAR